MRKRELASASGGGRENLSPRDPKIRAFNSLLVESIIESIDFGEVVLRFFESFSSIRRDKLVEEAELFEGELDDLMGDSAVIIKEKIARTLCSKLGIDHVKRRDCTFSEYVKTVLEKYLENVRQ